MRASTIAWIRLMRVFQKIDHASAERFRTYGLSVARFDMLNHAGTSEGRTQQEIASSLLVTKGNITQLLDAMEQDGLLLRHKDGRCNRIYLTDEGRALRETMVHRQEAAIEEAFAVLTADEVAELGRILRKLDRSLGPP
jgi:DNA-binding MarR family transcriptional regulator